MKKIAALICLVLGINIAIANDCTLTVNDKNLGTLESTKLTLIGTSDTQSKVYAGEVSIYSAAVEITTENKAFLIIGDENGNSASAKYDVSSNKVMELNIWGNKRYATLSCN